MKSEVRKSGNRLEITRVFNAPRALVFSCWATAEKYEKWASCKECVRSEVVMDFRVGGSFTQTMYVDVHGEICEFPVSGVYEEIVEPDRIVYRGKFGEAMTRVTVEFSDHGTGTKVVLTHESCPDESFMVNVSRGTAESFEKLAVLLS